MKTEEKIIYKTILGEKEIIHFKKQTIRKDCFKKNRLMKG